MKSRFQLWAFVLAAVSLLGAMTAQAVPQPPAHVLYWDPQGTGFPTGNPGIWDNTAAAWSTTTNATPSPVPWVPGDVACFGASAFVTQISVQITNTVSCCGIYNGGLVPKCSLSIFGTGPINLASNFNYIYCGGGITLGVPIVGTGAIQYTGTGGLGISASHSYSGGTQFGTTSNDFGGLLNFGNNAPFGTGPIIVVSSGIVFSTPPGGSSVFTNAWKPTPLNLNFTVNFSANSPSTLTLAGPWTLPNSFLPVGVGSVGTGSIIISGVISGSAPFNKVGTGKLILSASNTFSGGTEITAGILALGAGGSISKSAFVQLDPGTRFDVSAVNPFSIDFPTALAASSLVGSPALLTAANGGSVSVNHSAINLNYTPGSFSGDSTNPCLKVTAGALAFNQNTFNITNSGTSPLGPGVYRIIQDDGGPITGTITATPQIFGRGLTSGSTASLVIADTNLNLVVTAIPSFTGVSASPSMLLGSIINVTVSGTISASSIYPNPGESVTVNLNGAVQTGTIGTFGSFHATFPFVSIPYSPTNYPLTLIYAGDIYLRPRTSTPVITANTFMPATAVWSGAPPAFLTVTNTSAATLNVWSCTNASVPVTLWTLEGKMTEQPLNDGSGKSVYSLQVNPNPAPMFYVIGTTNQWPFASPTFAQWFAADDGETYYTTNTTISAVGVLQLPSPPVILLQPNSQTVLAGKNVGFNYSYSSTTPATNQWYFNLTNPLPAQNGFTLLSNVTADCTGTYDFVVSSEFGSVTSEPVTLMVMPPPQITFNPAPDSIELLATAPPSQRYTIQTATDLTAPVAWKTLATGTATTNGTIDFAATNSVIATNLFYRVQFP